MGYEKRGAECGTEGPNCHAKLRERHKLSLYSHSKAEVRPYAKTGGN